MIKRVFRGNTTRNAANTRCYSELARIYAYREKKDYKYSRSNHTARSPLPFWFSLRSCPPAPRAPSIIAHSALSTPKYHVS